MKRFWFRASACVLALLGMMASGGCSCGGPAPGADGSMTDRGLPNSQLLSISILPADLILDVTPGAAGGIAYTATGQFADGAVADITDFVMWYVDNPVLGTFAGNVFTPAGDVGGATTVHAWSAPDGLGGETTLVLRVRLDFANPGVPSNPGDYFTGSAGGAAPALIYPNDGVLLPPNLRLLEVHWLPGAGNDLFELRFVSTAGDVRVYTTCPPLGGGCGFQLDEAQWLALAETNRGGLEVTVELRGTTAAGGPGGTFGTAPSRTLRFSADDLLGGLYYWAATPGAIMRYDFGLGGQSAELYYGPAQGGGLCVGCHALSHSGDRIAVGSNIPSPAGLTVLDVATTTTLFTGASNFQAFSPDSALIITSDGNTMVLHDANTGAVLMNPLSTTGTMPDWSPDGLSIVFSRPANTIPCPIPGFCGVPGVDAGSLFILATDGVSSFGPETPLAAEPGANYYYPAFSPDSEWVVFNRSVMNSYDAPDADLYAVRTDGSGAPVFLATADESVANSWPKWAPFENAIEGDPLMWITFSSRRDYGLRLLNSGQPIANQTAQIWMAAFRPDAKGVLLADPTYPAFWLPYQDINTGNHIPQWTENVDRPPCVIDMDCGSGEFCDGMVCIPIIG